MRVFPGISCITLAVRDVERATIFYEMLGWRVSRRASGPGESYFQLNNIVLALRHADSLTPVSGDQHPGAPAAILLHQHYGSERAVAKALDVAARAGASGLFGPDKFADGRSVCGFSDPDGHRWHIAFDPARPPSPDGSLSLPG
ncbi:MAG: Glyoxalase/bleomycin resistance protein/dioxygenase [Hyphomicrobiales bacterium]|jgi:catechol 2,3-dioxygenase-like lactoylglutathione lyase family enzyme|nr:Glyoxalase/bleomycin resistance protein/dioxygenase [Hyphomicrobiales bacterium]